MLMVEFNNRLLLNIYCLIINEGDLLQICVDVGGDLIPIVLRTPYREFENLIVINLFYA